MSEVDSEFQERQLEFESYAKRIQIDFNGEEFMDEFGRKQKFEDILAEEKRSIKKLEEEEIEKGMSEKSEKSVVNGNLEESYSSKHESYYEESYEKSSQSMKIEESKSSSKAFTGYSESHETKMSVETSISEASVSQKDSSKISFESEISSTEYLAEETSKLQLETSTKKGSKSKAELETTNFEEGGMSKSGMSLEVESSTSSSKSQQEQELKISASVEIEQTSVSTSKATSEEQLIVESDVSIDNSTSSRTTIEEREVKLTTSDAEIDSSRSRESTLEIDDSSEVFATEGGGAILVDSSVEIEYSKVKRKKRMSVEMEVEERSTVEIDLESKILKSKMLEEIKTMTAEMQTMSKDSIPTDMGSVSSINSLFSEEGSIEESSTSTNPSEMLEAKIRSKMQARVLETESNADAESVRDMDLSEGAADEKMIDDQIRAAVRAEHETLAQESNLQSDRVMDLPMGEKEQLSTSLGQDSGVFDMSTAENSSFRVEESSTKTTTESTATLGASRTDEAKIKSVEDDSKAKATSEAVSSLTDEQAVTDDTTEDLSSPAAGELKENSSQNNLEKTKAQRDLALAEEQQMLDKDDTSIVSDLTDLESLKADEKITEKTGKAEQKAKSKQELAKADEMNLGREDASVASELTDVDSVKADELSLDGRSELGEASIKDEETWHADQLSDTESMRDETSDFKAEDIPAVEADITEEQLGQNVKVDSVDSLDGPSDSRDVTPTPESFGAEDNFRIQSPINEETVSEISEGSIREADFALDETLPDGGQFVTSPSDLTSLVRDSQKQSRVSAQISEDIDDIIDDALKDLEMDSNTQETKITKEPSPDQAAVRVAEEILEAPQEKTRQMYKPEEQDLTFIPDEIPEKKTKSKKSKRSSEEEELTMTASVETSETSTKTQESTASIQADVDVSGVSYDDGGLTISASVEVEETRYPPEVVRVSEDVNIQAGETINLASEVKGNPQPEVKWFKEGEKITENQRITLVTEDNVYSLEIREAAGSDGGKYTLTAHNSEGTIFSDVQVNVTIPPGQEDKIIMEGQNISVTASLSLPEFTKSPDDTTVSEFDPVSFVCQVSGNPEPKVIWRKEGQKLKSDQRMRIYESDRQHFLEIPQSSLLDAGEYECEATNSEGSTSCHIMLTVEAATEQESGLSAAEESVQLPGASESDVRTRYLKLFGAAAAFTLVAFGLHKLTEGRLPTSR
ncbi:hypothetical protein LOTGIDRAFT_172618 [Lottia gigantea]|uniref:Ig-like domain-containing protein n=1 Tax=Lottia gigantea TaxID=225164 RepID=V4B658_LOTGI|nr:hypothetical protein LOTGIDRAFT_172618 [Lottia gigantea]ESP01582.1 hypothetical protein LOTGIDRAFT_172618 [Lottia gigantea]